MKILLSNYISSSFRCGIWIGWIHWWFFGFFLFVFSKIRISVNFIRWNINKLFDVRTKKSTSFQQNHCSNDIVFGWIKWVFNWIVNVRLCSKMNDTGNVIFCENFLEQILIKNVPFYKRISLWILNFLIYISFIRTILHCV